jgi:NAD(P)H-dependent nitrite reductase small subunit
MAFTKAATVEDVTAGHGKQVMINGRPLALFNVDGNYYAIDDTCPHRGGPLSEGAVAGAEVICPWHSARFDLKTGQVLGPPAKSGVKAYPVRVAGNEIEVDVI